MCIHCKKKILRYLFFHEHALFTIFLKGTSKISLILRKVGAAIICIGLMICFKYYVDMCVCMYVCARLFYACNRRFCERLSKKSQEMLFRVF